MTKKYQNKYRIESARKKGYDYSQNGAYFITIVTKNRECFFGNIVGKDAMHRVSTMELSEIGKIVWDEWLKTPSIRPDMNLEMVEFIVMPNHIHGIIYIADNEFNTLQGRDAMLRVSTEYKNKFEPQQKNLSSIIRGFKSAVTIKSREINPNFAWQPRFHDRIIRNENELNRKRKYIRENPAKWYLDRNNGDDLWL